MTTTRLRVFKSGRMLVRNSAPAVLALAVIGCAPAQPRVQTVGGSAQDAGRGATSGRLTATRMKLGHRTEKRFPVSIGSLAWIGETHRLAADWQTFPEHQLLTPTVGLIDLDTGVASPLSTESHREAGEYCWHPAVSQDGKRIAYIQFPNPDSAGKSGIWVYSLSDGSESKVGPTAAGMIQWTPDDKQLIYFSRHMAGGLWELDLARKRTLMLDGRFVQDIAVSPDGKLVAYMVWNRPGYELWVVNLQSRGRRLIAADAWSPSWHGTTLWYLAGHEPQKHRDSSQNGFGRTIACVDVAHESKAPVHLHGPTADPLALTRISPDGSHLWASTAEGQLWLLDITRTRWTLLDEHSEVRGVSGATWSPGGREIAWSREASKAEESVVTVLQIVPDSD